MIRIGDITLMYTGDTWIPLPSSVFGSPGSSAFEDDKKETPAVIAAKPTLKKVERNGDAFRDMQIFGLDSHLDSGPSWTD